MTAFVFIANFLGIGLLAIFLRRQSDKESLKFFWPAFTIKMLGGIALGLIYSIYYGGGDSFTFFDDAVKLNNLGRQDPGAYLHFLWGGGEAVSLSSVEPRSRFFVSLLSVVNFLTSNNYWASSLWFSFFSFVGAWFAVDRIGRILPGHRVAVTLAFLFIPSVVFWTSGILKESIAFGSLCFVTGISVDIITGKRLRGYHYPLLLFSSILLVYLKYYWAAVFFPAVLTSVVVKAFLLPRMRSLVSLSLGWVVIFVILCLSASFMHPNFYPDRFLSVIVENNEMFTRISSSQDVIHYYKLTPTWGSMTLNAPWALASGLFRPSLLEIHSVLHFLAALENAILIILVVVSFFRRFQPREGWILLQPALVYALVLCVLLALAAPNLGTLSRYRVGFLPFVVLPLLIHLDVSAWRIWPKIFRS